jgi:hypothetical protein
MLLNDIYLRLGQFVTNSVNDPLVSVVYAYQNMPRTLKPSVTIEIGKFVQIGTAMRYEIDDNGLQDVILNKTFNVTFKSYADGLHEAEQLLNTIQNNLMLDIAYNHFKADISYNKTLMGVTSLPMDIGGNNESRAVLDTEFIVNQLIIDNIGLIEHIEITDMLTGNEFTINK